MNLQSTFTNRKVQIVIAVVLISIAALFLKDLNPTTFDGKLGIEFVGEVRIPVTLEKSVDPNTMDSIVQTLKTRINSFGLSQAIVRPVGDKEVLVEIPKADDSAIAKVQNILQEQGKFEALIDTRQALSGDDVIDVGGAGHERTPKETNQPLWEVDFIVTEAGSDKFAQTAQDKADYPVFMFLDRPESAIILASKKQIGQVDEQAIQEAMKKEGDDLQLYYTDDFQLNKEQILQSAKTRIVIPKSLKVSNPEIITALQNAGYVFLAEAAAKNATKYIVEKDDADFAPVIANAQLKSTVSEWKAIGLLSSPRLSQGLANGYKSRFYSVTGGAQGATTQEQEANALSEIKRIKTVLTGGKLPVSTTIGSSFSIAPQLGSQFLTYSAIATILAIAAVAVLIVIRYGSVLLSFPIIIINACEVIITAAVIGTFGTIDLAAMAGIIALIGTGVDDQIIITDEMLRKKKAGSDEEEIGASGEKLDKSITKEKLAKAFQLIFTTAGVAIVAMIPLLTSGVVEITGFAVSAIIGILVGIFITRPAYGVLMEQIFGKN